MESVVFVHLMGGIGNQLFQYAAGMLQVKITNGKLYLEKAVENNHDTADYRDTLFTLGEKYDGQLPHHISHYQENSFAYWNPHDYKYPILLLYGYFQNYRSLKPILPEFKNSILENLKYKREYVVNKYKISFGSAFIHVRRGDYLKYNAQLTNTKYYTDGIDNISSNHMIRTWYILSDDIEWCKTSGLFDSINKVYVEDSDPVICLAFMSEIKDAAIIANSTFSWMGAYLGCGTKPNSVIYPKIWINTGTPDLFPEEWIGL